MGVTEELTKVTVGIPEAILKRIDATAKAHGVSRAWIIRKAIEMSIDDVEREYGDW